MSSLDGKIALVTGGSRGIGAAIAKDLATNGAVVVFTYATAADQAVAVAKQIEADGGRALAIQADIGDPAAVADAVRQAVEEFGGLDILVNNAGVLAAGPLEGLGLADIDRSLAVNVRGVLLAVQAALPHLREGGRIITVGSTLADRVPGAGLTLYSLTKSALTGLTKGLARDLGSRGIGVTLVQPGPIDTDMNPGDGESADLQRSWTAFGRYGTREDVALTVTHIAGDGGRYMTGSAVTVDGGLAA
jgi:3-oxoacyl-[acyl-carrier protein] reductase